MMFGPLDLVIHLKNLCWENDPPNKKHTYRMVCWHCFIKLGSMGIT